MKNLTLAAIALATVTWLATDTHAQKNDDKPFPGRRGVEKPDRDGKQDGERGPQTRRRRGGPQQGQPGDRNPGGRRGGDFAKMMFQRMDKDGDGVVLLSEVPERGRDRVGRLDTNSDGKLELKEVQEAMAKLNPQGRPGKPGQGKPGQRKPGMERPGFGKGGPGGQNQDRLKMMFQRIDQNGDGKISLDEAPEKMQSRFAQLDANGDEQIDMKEMSAIAERMKQRGQAGPGGKGRRGGGDTKPQRPKRPGGKGGDGGDVN